MDRDRLEDIIDAQLKVVFIYRLIGDPMDMFIFMAVMQVGFKQEEVARMLGISQEAVNARLTKVRKLLQQKDPDL